MICSGLCVTCKKLRENIVVFGLGAEFEENEHRIMQRSHILACTDNYRIPEDEFWKPLYAKPDKIASVEADKFLICTHRFFDEIRAQLLGQGVAPAKIIDIDGLRFDKL